MDHQLINDQQFLARYRTGALSEAERDSFEIHLLDCKECQSDLEADEALAKGLAAAMEGQPRHRAAPDRYRPLAMAASVLLVVTLGALAWMVGRGPADPLADAPQSQVLFLERVRDASAETVAPVQLDPRTRLAVLVLDAVQPEIQSYDVRILAAGGAEVWSARNLTAAAAERPSDRGLVVLVPTQSLPPGAYLVQVTGIVEGRSIASGQFRFQVAAP